jgi:hypothetical protein
MAPIIKIEIEHMKHSLFHAFNEQMFSLDESFKAALDEATKPEKIQAIVNDAANKHIADAIEEEVRRYFCQGDGRKIIAEKVKEKLAEDLR